MLYLKFNIIKISVYLTRISLRKFTTKINYYKILNIDPDSKPDKIKTSYYSLAKLYHPDSKVDKIV